MLKRALNAYSHGMACAKWWGYKHEWEMNATLKEPLCRAEVRLTKRPFRCDECSHRDLYEVLFILMMNNKYSLNKKRFKVTLPQTWNLDP